jgi:hypothetical protein
MSVSTEPKTGPGNPKLTTGSLLEDAGAGDFAPPPRQRKPAGESLKAGAARLRAICWGSTRGRVISGAVAALLLGGGATGAYFALRPVPVPDYEEDPLSMVFDFTLLEEEFNNLPVEERIALLSVLWERMQGMDNSDSLLMASFAAGIMGPMREQLERNMSRLMIDAGDQFAAEYTEVPGEEREQWLEDAYVRMARLTEPFDPGLANRSDEDILRRGRRDAQRNADALERGEVSPEAAGRFLSFAYRQGRDNGNRREQQRLVVFFRDMTRQLREGGEPTAPSAPAAPAPPAGDGSGGGG